MDSAGGRGAGQGYPCLSARHERCSKIFPTAQWWKEPVTLLLLYASGRRKDPAPPKPNESSGRRYPPSRLGGPFQSSRVGAQAKLALVAVPCGSVPIR